MTKLGIGTYAYAWAIGVSGYDTPNLMDVFQFIETVDNHGVKVAQIADNIPLHELSSEQLTQLKSLADDKGISLEVGTRGITADHLNIYIAIALQLSSPILRVVVDTNDHHPSPDEVINLLQPQLQAFEEANIILAIENHDRFPAQTLVKIMQTLDSPYVGICLDTVNSFGSLEGPAYVIEKLAPYVVNLHVKDFSIARHDHNMGFTLIGTPAGQGMLDTAWVMQQLDKYGRDYNAILELWPPPENTIQATIAKEHQWAGQSISYLRTLLKD